MTKNTQLAVVFNTGQKNASTFKHSRGLGLLLNAEAIVVTRSKAV